MRRAWASLLALLLVLAAAGNAFAHKPSDSYVTLEIDGATVHGRWDVALRDLDYAIGIDGDGNGEITWAELKAKQAAIAAYELDHLKLASNGAPCPATPDSSGAVASHTDGTYAVVRFEAKCDGPIAALEVDYTLLFDLDPQHRGILRVDAGGTSRTFAASISEHARTFSVADAARGKQLANIVKEGITHIWEGYDHILFLLALLLPSVLRRDEKKAATHALAGLREGIRLWEPVPRLKPALLDVFRIVTSFTVAHSITLSLAALGVVTLPSRLVESAIAASVVLAALNNLWPILRQDRWMAAFLLGLMHGFGFSSTLMDLDLPRSSLVLTLFGFNLGVEIGQLAIVCVFVPLAYAARQTLAYRRVGLVFGSAVIVTIATLWLIERAFLVRILS